MIGTTKTSKISKKAAQNVEEDEESKFLGASPSQVSIATESDDGPDISELAKCYVMNKSLQLKSRLVYISDMTLYITYLSEEGDQLIVAISV